MAALWPTHRRKAARKRANRRRTLAIIERDKKANDAIRVRV